MSRNRNTTQPLHTTARTRDRAFGLLLLFVALNAVGGGVYGVTGAPAVPREWLIGSPFATYLVPSLVLLVVVGGIHTVAGIALLRAWPNAYRLAVGAGAVLTLWIVVQVRLIGYVSWLQPAMFIIGALTIVLALRLHRQRR